MTIHGPGKAKLTADRLWCLKWWGQNGWSIGRPMSRGIAKWEHHIAMLTKAGLLEADHYGMHRITPLGLSALSQIDNTGGGE